MVERTEKKNGEATRTRRCGKCDGLFKTVEKTEDEIRGDEIRAVDVVEKWMKRVTELEGVVDGVKLLFEIMERLKDQVGLVPEMDEYERE